MPLDLQLRLDRPDMAGPQRRLGTDKLAPCSTAGDGQTYRQQVLACLAWSVSLVGRQSSMFLLGPNSCSHDGFQTISSIMWLPPVDFDPGLPSAALEQNYKIGQRTKRRSNISSRS
jgi:hypothetical protein